MPLLVVPLGSDQAGSLTLNELDRLLGCDRVLFEDPAHPLMTRLSGSGIDARKLEEDLDATRDGWALVAEPGSSLVLELAHAGAEVSSGVAPAPDALTAARGAHNLREASAALGGAALIMARLRSEDGCPWDREQTHESLKVHLLEEAYEVIDAIDAGSTGEHLEEELGDLLLQVLFHARLADQDGRFDIAGVAAGLVAKLVRRHPHVFGDVAVADATEVLANWEQIKQSEKLRSDAFEGIPEALPALLNAYKVQKRAASLGFAADEERARTELTAALEAGLDRPETLGRALFWLVALARAAGIEPEGALRAETTKFKSSF
ncbi:MAG: nucleoside triphosphate pyrophosphohydrolase [Actinomycetota bacterium]